MGCSPMTALEMADEAVGAQVRAIRLSRGMSLRSLARAISVSPATLSQIENGRTGLTVSRLRDIAAAMQVSVAQILDTVVSDPESIEALAEIAHPPPIPPPADASWRAYGPIEFDPVLQAALDEFLHIGYHGASVRGIAARAGLSVSGIYHYYPSKQHMLLRLLEYTMDDLLRRAEAARSEGRDAVERFRFLVEHLALFHTHRRDLGFIGASEMRSLSPANARRIAGLRNKQSQMVYEEVDTAVREGRFTADKPHERARAVVTMCTALPTWWRPHGPYTPEQIAQQYESFALDLMECRR
ncbi:transcriptional regulator, TetR family [Pseudonocardia thermophila]|jgi:Transcriptional regulator|uniref:Transcriptional regulator, TetR family n=2 Tax=Pseudonocardia thermophila TaxID=1848 RepID=A0A1M6YNY2_PSETH|nr:transcriptional regulator, TetR family [Pseudonocardia thermophila]